MEQSQADDQVGQQPWSIMMADLMKTAALRKQKLELQLVRVKILALRDALKAREQALQTARTQKIELEDERAGILHQLNRVNENHKRAEDEERSIAHEVQALETQIHCLAAGDLAATQARFEVLREELGVVDTDFPQDAQP